jgi:hypothetical protein
MPSHSPIADYAAALSRELAFDGPLSRRVREEVEDHLWEAVASEPDQDPLLAQRRAVVRFGDPRAIAAQYAASSLYRQTKTVGLVAVLVIAGVYLTMKGRVAWYGLMHWGMGDQLRAALEVPGPVIRYNFMVALVLGIVGWIYSVSRKAPPYLDLAHRRQLRVSQLISGAATAAIVLSVILDIGVTAGRLSEVTWSAQALVPVGLVVAEIVWAIMLTKQLLGTVRRTGLAASSPDLMRPI